MPESQRRILAGGCLGFFNDTSRDDFNDTSRDDFIFRIYRTPAPLMVSQAEGSPAQAGKHDAAPRSGNSNLPRYLIESTAVPRDREQDEG